eukprot:c4833_g1_i1.p1 GENE.c4833_g1_i1~~c4833_g1_i1.p1  ORF type:complete len:197 (+),score=36.20 c4833_g1_i1:50-592(+)
MVRVVSTHDEFKKILGSASPQQLVVVDFTAAWCGPCQSIAPVYEELSKKYPQTLFLKVDVDENRDTAVANEIQAMPTFLFFKASKKIHALKGADPARLEAAITQHSGDRQLPPLSTHAHLHTHTHGRNGVFLFLFPFQHIHSSKQKCTKRRIYAHTHTLTHIYLCNDSKMKYIFCSCVLF